MGGIEYNAIHLAEALDKSRFSVVFVCPGEEKLTNELKSNRMPFILYKGPHFLSTSNRIFGGIIFNPFATLYNFLNFPYLSFHLFKILRKEKFDLVITKGLLANFYGSLASWLAGIPCLWDMQEIVSKKKCFGLISLILNIWVKIFAKGVILPSEAIRGQFLKSVHPKTFLVPNGIDIEKYHPGVDPQPVRKEWNIKETEVLIGHIARFTYWKGQKDFVEAAEWIAKEIPNAKFVLVGSPVFENEAYEREVKELTRELGLNGRVLFPGFRDDLANVMAALDIFVHCSVEPEGCPITLITAMAMAKPVVCTEVLGNKEIISDATQAILIPPDQPEALAKALLRIIRDPTLMKSMGENSRKRILERYSLKAYAAGCGEAFGKIKG